MVHYNEPLVLLAKEKELSHKQVHSAHKGTFSDQSLTWDHHGEGEVTDVVKTLKGVTVVVKAYSPSQVGDKISGRHGDKGVISSIISDHEMPRDAQGRPFEVLANPLGIISRSNPAQVIEAQLGRIAERTKKPYVLEDFPDDQRDWTEWTLKELGKHNLEDTEAVTDPLTGRKIPNILVGNRYFMKLSHMAESKGQGRGLGAYTSEDMPARGGPERSKKFAMTNVTSALSSGATEVLRDMKLVLGQKNPEYWSSFMAGNRPPTPQD